MTIGNAIELAIAIGLLVAGVFFYRRRDRSDSYGSQGAVILFVLGIIVAIHAFSLMEYRPSTAELEIMQERAR